MQGAEGEIVGLLRSIDSNTERDTDRVEERLQAIEFKLDAIDTVLHDILDDLQSAVREVVDALTPED